MFQISAMINLKIKFEGSANRPCAKHNEEQRESFFFSGRFGSYANFGLFVMVVSFCCFSMQK